MGFQSVWLFVVAANAFIASAAYGQSASTLRNEAILLRKVIETHHYSPPPIDDRFASRIFDKLIERLNNQQVYLSKADISKLEPFRNTIDDELKGKGWNFTDTLAKLYRHGVANAIVDLANTAAKSPDALRLIKKLQSDPGCKEYVSSIFLDVLANAFDPHTEYMAFEEKRAFESALDTQGYYFGFSLEENDDGQVEIARIMPGSPAWKSGELNSGDRIISMGMEGHEPIKANEGGPEQFAEVLERMGTDNLKVTVLKADGTLKSTSLKRAKITNEENVVRGYVLKGERTMGYIYLPDFYTGHDGSSASCANDVAREIVKLKKENIDGLILDLRYNGGGSLQEALDMAGIFVDAGPLCIVKEKTGHTYSLKDMNRGTIYDGPLTLLINGQSASASELLGAVLQDYNRAFIVGSPSFGKGSVQQIFPLDSTMAPGAESSRQGFVKITTSKFYRVSGATTQNTGVIPDIRLPDVFDVMGYKEAALPFALPADSVPRNRYYKPLSPLPVSELAEKSRKRVSENTVFTIVRNYIDSIKSGRDPSLITAPVLPAVMKYTVTNASFDQNLIRSSAYLTELNERWVSRIKSDIYVEEAYQILADYLTTYPK